MRLQNVIGATAAILLLLMVAVVGAWADEALQATPKLIVEETSHTFEPVVDGAVVSHDFVVRNDGDEILKINKVKTG